MTLRQPTDPVRSQLSSQHRNVSMPSFKTEEYQSKISELSKMVKVLRQRLNQMERRKSEEIERELMDLKVENGRMIRENRALRVRVHDLQQMLKGEQGGRQRKHQVARSMPQGFDSNPSYQQQDRLSKFQKDSVVTTTHLLRQLLAECNQPSESGHSSKPQQIKDEFYQFRSSEDCFQPWFGQLPKEMRIRLKRCLTRQKELLWSNSNAQLGCICPFNFSTEDAPHIVKLLIVLTNTTLYPVNGIVLEPLHAKDVVLNRKSNQKGGQNQGKWQYPNKQLKSNEQLREEVEVVVNNIDFRCVQLELQFRVNGTTYQQLLILPLSKGKLFRHLPYTAPPSRCQRVQRVFDFQRKVLSEVSKLGKLWGVVEGRERVGGARYCWKIQFLDRSFWVEAGGVEQRLMVGVKYQNQRALAEKIVQEYVFLFQKL